MVRLVMLLAPAACVLSAIGVSGVLRASMEHIDMDAGSSVLIGGSGGSAAASSGSASASKASAKSKGRRSEAPLRSEFAAVVVFIVSLFLVLFGFHSTWVTSEAHSAPSIVLTAKQPDGTPMIYDDFRQVTLPFLLFLFFLFLAEKFKIARAFPCN